MPPVQVTQVVVILATVKALSLKSIISLFSLLYILILYCPFNVVGVVQEYDNVLAATALISIGFVPEASVYSILISPGIPEYVQLIGTLSPGLIGFTAVRGSNFYDRRVDIECCITYIPY